MFDEIIKGVLVDERRFFYPDSLVTRAEAAIIVIRINGISEENLVNENEYLIDIKDKWYEKAIRNAYLAGLVKGDNNRRFNGENNVTQEEIITLSVRIFMSDDEVKTQYGNIWPNNYIEAAKELGIVGEDEQVDNSYATREYAVLKYVIPYRLSLYQVRD